MPVSNITSNTALDLTTSDGGQIGLVHPGGVVQAVVSTVPCRQVYISANAASDVHIGLTTSINASLGVQPPVSIVIDDMNKIWVFADAVASVFMTYRR